MLLVIILSFLLTSTLAQNLPSLLHRRFKVLPPCGESCQFRSCRDGGNFVLTAPGLVSGPEICRKGQEIDRILETGEPLVALESKNVPFSEWRPGGLLSAFPPDFFKACEIPGSDNSGIKRINAQANQTLFLRDTCIILPIKRYQMIRRRKNNAKRVVLKKGRNPLKDCIAWVPLVFDIQFEVQWFSGDDLDLSVQEPDGTIVDFKNRRSTCGNLHSRDQGLDGCGFNTENLERIVYSRDCPAFQSGTYNIMLRHASNCLLTDPPEDTRYQIRVVVDGVTKRKHAGHSNKDNDTLITYFSYEI